MLTFGSVCSGIEAASVAWKPLGWTPAFFSEIDRFPGSVLTHHHSDTPNHGDMMRFKEWPDANIDVLVGGTPCQSFSVAGLRKGLDDPRGNLTLVYLALADRYRPRWVVWENVPGVLSDDGGRTFGTFLGGLAKLGYGWAYRVLDAQYFGLAQRRKRVFVVGCLGDWRGAAAVFLERESLRWNPAPRRETRKGIAPTISARPTGGGGLGTDFDLDGGLVTHALRADGFDASEDGTGRGTPIIPILEPGKRTGKSTTDIRAGLGVGKPGDPMFTLQGGAQHAIAFSAKDHGADAMDDLSPTLRAGGHHKSHANAGVMPAIAFNITPSNSNKDYNARQASYAQAVTGNAAVSARGGDVVTQAMSVRRLTPRECERLQGFPDDYTLIPYRSGTAADGPRYKALGNSMAVPVMRWIGERIAMADDMLSGHTARLNPKPHTPTG